MPDRTISILGATLSALIFSYLALMVFTVSLAAWRTDLASEVRDTENAIALLEQLPSRGDSPWLFPSATAKSGHVVEPGKAWARIRATAGLSDCRLHDLRRTVASWMVGAGYSLPLVGKFLGHTQPSATAVYARLDTAPVRVALERVSALMLGGAEREVIL